MKKLHFSYQAHSACSFMCRGHYQNPTPSLNYPNLSSPLSSISDLPSSQTTPHFNTATKTAASAIFSPQFKTTAVFGYFKSVNYIHAILRNWSRSQSISPITLNAINIGCFFQQILASCKPKTSGPAETFFYPQTLEYVFTKNMKRIQKALVEKVENQSQHCFHQNKKAGDNDCSQLLYHLAKSNFNSQFREKSHLNLAVVFPAIVHPDHAFHLSDNTDR